MIVIEIEIMLVFVVIVVFIIVARNNYICDNENVLFVYIYRSDIEQLLLHIIEEQWEHS